MGKKKTQRQQDFQKVKLKVGKKLQKSQNETKISLKSKKILIRDQLKVKNSEQPATYRQLTIKDLLNHLSHHNASVRHDGVSGILEIFSRDEAAILDQVSSLIERISPIFVDKDANVRKVARNLLRKIFVRVTVSRMEPFFPLLVAHLCCAMTHIDEDVRRDSLEIFDLCLDSYSGLVVRDVKRFFEHFLRQISSKIGFTSDVAAALLVTPTDKISADRWRKEVFDRLSKMFKALSADLNAKSGTIERGLLSETTPISELTTPIMVYMTSSRFILHRATAICQDTFAGAFGPADVLKFGETVVPLLCDSWLEAAPLDSAASSSRVHSRNLPYESFALLGSIVSFLQAFLSYAEKLDESGESVVTSLSKEHFSKLANRFVPSFPIAESAFAKKRKQDGHAPFINLGLCEILTFDVSVFSRKKRPSWLDLVVDHLENFFSSLREASEENVRLALRILGRCCRSPSFAVHSFPTIFREITPDYFELDAGCQLSILKFFSDFLVEFSGFSFKKDSAFIKDGPVQAWLAKLPAFLKRMFTETPPSPDGKNDLRKTYAERVFHLFFLAARQGHSESVPCSELLIQLLDRNVYDILTPKLQIQLLTLLGRTDLDGDNGKLLNHLSAFILERPFSHRVLVLETLELGCNRDSLIAFCLSLLMKKSFVEIKRSLTWRFGKVGILGCPRAIEELLLDQDDNLLETKILRKTLDSAF